MKHLSKLSMALVLVVLALSSCQKEPVIKKKDTGKTTNATNIVAQVKYLTNDALGHYGVQGFAYRISDMFSNVCANVTIDSSSSPFIATLDFGSGCTNPDGSIISGVNIIRYPASEVDLNTPNTILETEFQNYGFDSAVLNGTLTFENKGVNGSGNLHGEINFGFNIVDNKTGDIYNGTYVLTFEEFPTYYLIGGSLSATDNHGNSLTHAVVDPLWQGKDVGCKGVYTKGIVHVVEPSDDYYIDYGSGGCDLIAHEVRGGVRTQVTAGEEED